MTKQEKPEELIQAKKLIDECKLDEAEQLIKNFEEKEGHSLHDLVLCHLLKCELLGERGLNKDVVKLTEETYKESLGLGKSLLSVDILLEMAMAQLRLVQTDKSYEIIKQGEYLLKNLAQELPADYKQREAYIAYLKGWMYDQKSDADQAIKQFELSLSLREELGVKQEIAYSLTGIAQIFLDQKGDSDRALKYLEQGLVLAEESGNKGCIGYCLYRIAEIYGNKGEIDRSIMLFEQSLTIFKEFNNKFMTARILNDLGWIYTRKGELNGSIRVYEQGLKLFKEFNNKYIRALFLNSLASIYKMKGELDRAIECIEQSIAINRELDFLRPLAKCYDNLIQILIEMGDLERAQNTLGDLEKLSNQSNYKTTTLMYRFDKALLLKISPRARNRVKAEEIFKNILEEDAFFGLTVGALLNLCDLLLIELRTINNIEVLGEIEPYINRLLDIAEKSKSYWILCETHILQAKLSLLTFNIKKTQRFLTQAQQIAERFNLNQLVSKITNEKEELLKKLELWERLKEIGAPMADRFELARLDEQIAGLVRSSAVLTAQLTEEKIAVSKEKKICLVCRGEVLRFSYICECGAIYCENCARAVSDLENVCWVCDIPIDYSKPVKIIKEETESIKDQEKAKKK